MKRFLSGLAAGFASVGAVLFFMGAFRPARESAEPETSRAVATPAADPRPGLRAEIAALERENSELAVKRAQEPPIPGAAAVAPSTAESFKAAVARLVALLTGTRRALNDRWFSGSLECDAIKAEFAAQVARLAAETGLREEEILLSPDFRWALLAEAYATRTDSLDDEERARFAAASAKARKDWDAYAAARDGLPPLEQMKALQAMEAGVEQAMHDTRLGDPFNLESIAPFAHPCQVPYPPTFRTEAEAVTAMRDAWAADFGLDATDAAALEPAVRDFMRLTEEYMTSRRAQVKRREELPDWRLGELDAMIETRRWIEQNVALTEAQRRALRDWSKLYEYRIDPASPGK